MEKLLTVLASLFLLSSCATLAPVSDFEDCASRGLVYQGTNYSSSTATAYSGGKTATAYGSSETVSCRVPQTPREECVTKHIGAAAKPKLDYNDGVPGKRLLTGVGYVLYLLPGFILNAVYDSDREEAIKASQAYIDANKDACRSAEPVAKN